MEYILLRNKYKFLIESKELIETLVSKIKKEKIIIVKLKQVYLSGTCVELYGNYRTVTIALKNNDYIKRIKNDTIPTTKRE